MIKLYNTKTKKKEDFIPLKKGGVGIYSCGPTVYWNQHIGNMYAYVQWDTFIKLLRYLKYKVKWVMNITDVGHMTSDEDEGEDKIEKGAKRDGLDPWQVAEKYIKQFKESMNILNIKEPDVLCRATDHIKEQIELIKKIEKNGFAYKTKTGLVFDVSKFKDYAKFANLKLQEQEAGARVKIDPEKRQPWDFLLWVTNQPSHIMKWKSPWGEGFPGWHIECTAMSMKYLGKKFDIHTGGKEHIPVHHTNEIAQTFGAFSDQAVNYWIHNEWLLIDNQKVSKSLGNVILVQDFEEPLAFRYLALTSYYRQGLNFSKQALIASQNALNSLRDKFQECKKSKEKVRKDIVCRNKEQFLSLLENDLGFPQGLAFLWQIVKDKNVNNAEKYLLLKEADIIFSFDLGKKQTVPPEIQKMAKDRQKAREQKDWQKSDQIRNDIEKQGYIVEDSGKQFLIKRK